MYRSSEYNIAYKVYWSFMRLSYNFVKHSWVAATVRKIPALYYKLILRTTKNWLYLLDDKRKYIEYRQFFY